ncbi:putative methyltransferase, YaeB/AF_0241 family [Raoultella terrigena]|uniref:Putative methyltransferase, YaeB/AF_0241 family n=1 Tax=Raoultella terrigena TaxID=577 RepID=A0A4U9DD06_RAOTE|nr:putative methyltransferase, YaeB/AF_0241 family [Raoultella terrigena]
MSSFEFAQIGVIRSPYKEKFAVPRQPGLVKNGGGELHLLPPYNQADAVRGLENFSHLWVLFVFSSNHGRRLATYRAPSPPRRQCANGRFRHALNLPAKPIGMSLVELKGIRCQKDRVILELGSLDLVDGTPVVDIKPYLPFAEALPDASASYAQQAPLAEMTVSFTPEMDAQLALLEKALSAA